MQQPKTLWEPATLEKQKNSKDDFINNFNEMVHEAIQNGKIGLFLPQMSSVKKHGIKGRAIKGLVAFGKTHGAQALIDALQSNEWLLNKSYLITALSRFHTQEAFNALIAEAAKSKYDSASQLASKLSRKMISKMPSSFRFDYCSKTLSNIYAEDQLRSNAAEALGELGDTRAVEVLIEALTTPGGAIPLCAARALGKLKDSRAVTPLIRRMEQVAISKGHQDLHLISAISWALGEIGDPNAIEPIKQMEDWIKSTSTYSYKFDADIKKLRSR